LFTWVYNVKEPKTVIHTTGFYHDLNGLSGLGDVVDLSLGLQCQFLARVAFFGVFMVFYEI